MWLFTLSCKLCKANPTQSDGQIRLEPFTYLLTLKRTIKEHKRHMIRRAQRYAHTYYNNKYWSSVREDSPTRLTIRQHFWIITNIPITSTRPQWRTGFLSASFEDRTGRRILLLTESRNARKRCDTPDTTGNISSSNQNQRPIQSPITNVTYQPPIRPTSLTSCDIVETRSR